MTIAEIFTTISVIVGLVAVIALGVAPFFIPLYLGQRLLWLGILAVSVSISAHIVATQHPNTVIETETNTEE